MARVLAVDDDTLALAVLVDVVTGLGHQAVGVSSAEDALAHLELGPFGAVVSDVRMPGLDGFALAARIAERGGPPVILASGSSRGDAEGQASRIGVRIAGFLRKPVRPEQLGPLLERIVAAPAAPSAALAPGGPGIGGLDALDGTLESAPLLHALFLAHRLGASGVLSVASADVQASIAIRAGSIVHVQGLPGLLRALDPRLADQRWLGRDVAAAVAAGHDAQRALDVAAEGLGDVLVKLAHLRGGRVRFDASAPAPEGSVPLAATIPRIIAGALRRARTLAQLQRSWAALAEATASARLPTDSEPERWGIGPTARRILELAQVPLAVGPLLEQASGGDAERHAECLVAIDLLHSLGLLAVDGGALEARGDTTGDVLRGREGATQEDPRLARLRQALAAMEGQHAVDVLGLGDRIGITADEVAEAYREQSRQYHPDHFDGAPPLLRGLAEACFARVCAAKEALAIPGGMAEAGALLAARAEGRPFVSTRDGLRARAAFRRGELLFRNRDWRGADAEFQEALRKDPTAWPHALYAARAGYLSKRLRVGPATDALETLLAQGPRRGAEVHVAVGTIMKLEGRPGEALRRFQAALDLDPENRDAQREVLLAQQPQGEDRSAPGSARVTDRAERRKP